MNIKLNINLSAYSKGVIPDVSDFIKDAPNDGKFYGRHNKEWASLEDFIVDQQVDVQEGSGLTIVKRQDGQPDLLSVRQQVVDTLPVELEDDTTYYVIDNTPDLYLNGGTAFSDGHNDLVESSEYTEEIEGGSSGVVVETVSLEPVNSKGEAYNG